MRVVQNVFGSFRYWLAGLVVGAMFWGLQMQPLALLTMAVWIVVGIYGELELRGKASFWVAGLSVVLGSAVFIFGMLAWTKSLGIDLEQLTGMGIENLLSQLNAGKGSAGLVQIDPKTVLALAPSAIVLLMLTSLAFALMLDRRSGLMLGLKFERVAGQLRLLEFKLPDAFIWVTMFSFLFSFLKLQPTWIGIVGTNVFNIMMGVYFFQGLAVLEVSFLVFRAGNFTKFLVYFFVVGQLFLLLSAVGVIDYWIDFRARLRRMRTPEKNHKNGEHI